jgi:glutaredoxin
VNYYRLFVKKGCPYCETAIRHLSKKESTYVVIQTTKKKLIKIKEHYNWRTVPLIVKINNSEETLIGGCSELLGENK